MKSVIVYGNLGEGVSLVVGPFKWESDAVDHAMRGKNTDYVIIPMVSPEEDS